MKLNLHISLAWPAVGLALILDAFPLAEANAETGAGAPARPVTREAALAEVEQFDLSGLPASATTFAEQQIHFSIREHQPGDVSDAIRIQRKMAAVYRERGDAVRADAADRRAATAQAALRIPAGSLSITTSSRRSGPESEAQRTVNPPAGAPPPLPAAAPPVPSAPAAKPAFTGLFYHMHSASALEKWDFNADGTFRHTWVGGGAGASSRTAEKGTFHLEGGDLVLEIGNVVSAYAANTGYKQTSLGAGTDESHEVRRMKLVLHGDKGSGGIALDGVEFKVRSWE